MKTFLMMVPRFDNHGQSLADEIKGFLSRVLRDAGGYTLLGESAGAWDDGNGKIFHDSNFPLLITCENPATVETLAQIARVMFRQQCVFLLELGEARFIFEPKKIDALELERAAGEGMTNGHE